MIYVILGINRFSYYGVSSVIVEVFRCQYMYLQFFISCVLTFEYLFFIISFVVFLIMLFFKKNESEEKQKKKTNSL
ncbi:MAG: hypothetical protein LBQ24_05730 [Candidatus Peribacteria bacterium]|nr:hypothetical protein [Candidatus Peribacteria bacterium]